MNNGIRVSYPRTKYLKVNEEIFNVISKNLLIFMDMAKNSVVDSAIYTIDISYDEYEYSNYLSFVFYISMYTGGAHSGNQIVTIVYDIKNDKLIFIDDLISKDKDILNKFSDFSRKKLLDNEKLVNKELLIEGTKPTKVNFSKFVFTKRGILLFFEPYQIAPYTEGSFRVLISYDRLNDKNLL